jgi:hypothetical protein
MPVTVEELAGVLRALGCPPEKCAEMATQLDRRADQLAEQKGRTKDQALEHLLQLMSQGWSAQNAGANGAPPAS